jgi:hypothetical protein
VTDLVKKLFELPTEKQAIKWKKNIQNEL